MIDKVYPYPQWITFIDVLTSGQLNDSSNVLAELGQPIITPPLNSQIANLDGHDTRPSRVPPPT